MTRAEAIRILDPATTGETLAEIEYYHGFAGKTAAMQAVSDACEIAVADMRKLEALENNEPLTIEKLRQMHGEPVWIKEIGKWGIVAVDQSGMWKGIPFVHARSFNLIVERNNFHCYRSKPEEETL